MEVGVHQDIIEERIKLREYQDLGKFAMALNQNKFKVSRDNERTRKRDKMHPGIGNQFKTVYGPNNSGRILKKRGSQHSPNKTMRFDSKLSTTGPYSFGETTTKPFELSPLKKEIFDVSPQKRPDSNIEIKIGKKEPSIGGKFRLPEQVIKFNVKGKPAIIEKATSLTETKHKQQKESLPQMAETLVTQDGLSAIRVKYNIPNGEKDNRCSPSFNQGFNKLRDFMKARSYKTGVNGLRLKNEQVIAISDISNSNYEESSQIKIKRNWSIDDYISRFQGIDTIQSKLSALQKRKTVLVEDKKPAVNSKSRSPSPDRIKFQPHQ